MPLPQWLTKALGACSRRRQPVSEETPFWEEIQSAKPVEEVEEEKQDPLGYEQAAHLQEKGTEKFKRGDTSEAMDMWVHALDALCAPPASAGLEDEDEDEIPKPALVNPMSDPKLQEMRVTLLLNLALGHKKLKQYRHAVNYCDEALLHQPTNVKALYRKADSLAELCNWKEAEVVLKLLDDTGDEGRKLAAQKRDEWRRRRKASDDKQKKIWTAAFKEEANASKTEDKENGKPVQAPTSPDAKATPKKPEVQERWVPPKVEALSVFDLRKKGVQWDESEDFDDTIWKSGLGRKEATYFQPRALPLSMLAGAVLADLDIPSELVIHCLLDGNMAPFAQPHDWSLFLRRCPQLRSMTVVYIDIGAVGNQPKEMPLSMPYGTLLRPTEEGRVGDRVARAARFLGTYKEFTEHCKELPGLVVPHIALWADVPFYGFNDEDFCVRLQAYEMLSNLRVPSVFTQGGEVAEPGGPPFTPKVDEQQTLTIAVLRLGFAARMIGAWHWNRFVVPLDRSEHGIFAAHALIGVTKPTSIPLTGKKLLTAVKDRLKQRCIDCLPYRMPKIFHEPEVDKMRKQQWEAFSRKLKAEGRPVGPNLSVEERHRQAMEFYQFCGLGELPPFLGLPLPGPP